MIFTSLTGFLDEWMYLQGTSAGTGSGYVRATPASTKRQCFKPETQMRAKGSRDLGLWLSRARTQTRHLPWRESQKDGDTPVGRVNQAGQQIGCSCDAARGIPLGDRPKSSRFTSVQEGQRGVLARHSTWLHASGLVNKAPV